MALFRLLETTLSDLMPTKKKNHEINDNTMHWKGHLILFGEER